MSRQWWATPLSWIQYFSFFTSKVDITTDVHLNHLGTPIFSKISFLISNFYCHLRSPRNNLRIPYLITLNQLQSPPSLACYSDFVVNHHYQRPHFYLLPSCQLRFYTFRERYTAFHATALAFGVYHGVGIWTRKEETLSKPLRSP